MGGGAGGGGGSGGGAETPEAPPTFKAGPMHIKYRAYTLGDDPSMDLKKTATQHLKDLKEPPSKLTGFRPHPEIIEFLNICDYTHQIESKLGVEEPLFQPYPPEISYHKYEPFKVYESTLWFRNNDNVPRRVKVEDPKSRHFSVKRVFKKDEDEKEGGGTGKVAPGMEVAYKIFFSPADKEDYSLDLVVATERERFVVPIRAVGNKPALDFPDAVEFEPTAAKSSSLKTQTVRNVGSKVANFRLFAPEPFTVQPSEGLLDVGECVQVNLGFAPEAAGVYEGEMEVDMGDGVEPVIVGLTGEGVELEVGLNAGKVEMLPTFINKTSQRTFKVVNRSEQTVRFDVKKLADSYLEEEARMRVSGAFGDTLRDSFGGGGGGAAGALSGEEDDSEGEDEILGSSAVEYATRARGLDKALVADPLLFEHDSFTCVPLSGEVVPGGETEITVRFHPNDSGDVFATCFVSVEGREDRLPLVLKGTGVGPLAVFSYDVLDVGDTFVNAVHQYEVELMNRGEIEAEFRLVPPTSDFARKFSFEPSAGVLSVGQTQVVTITLTSDVLGEFDESFDWQIVGGDKILTLDFRGRVVGPTFTIDAEELDFGIVSYGYRYTKEMTIHNSSEIPMRFNVRIPDDEGGADPSQPDKKPEFVCVPAAGTILPHGRQAVTVEFVSTTQRRYDVPLVIDVPGVGDALATVPIYGECCVPRITLPCDALEFGPCFVRHQYTKTMTLTNESKIPAKFEVVPQDEQSQGLALWTCSPEGGQIAACGEVELSFTLSTERLGTIHLPASIIIVGSKADPMKLTICAQSQGPQLSFSMTPDDPDSEWTPALDFGKVGVLTEVERKMYVKNNSLIPAEIKTFIGGSTESAFSIDVRQRTMEPGEEIPMTVKVQLDELIRFRDVLNVLVLEGAESIIPLEALGVGSVVTCDEVDAHGNIGFGPQFNGRPFTRELVLTNNGRKAQTLMWVNLAAEEAKKAAAAKEQAKKAAGAKEAQQPGPPGAAKKKKAKEPEPEPEPEIVFTVTPEKMSVQPKSSVVFTLTGMSHTEGDVVETLVCKNTAGGGKDHKEVMMMHASASVSVPYLEFSKNAIGYEYSYEPDVPLEIQRQPLTLRNVSDLPLSFSMQPSIPFAVDRPDWLLEPQEAVTVNVSFDAGYRADLQSHVVRNKLAVVYHDNPHKDAVDMSAEINFPNLTISTGAISFGSVLNDTTKREHITIKNVSSVPTRYEWVFVVDEEDPAGDADPSMKPRASRRGGMSKRMSEMPLKIAAPEQVFDILPIRGYLQPGEEEVVEVSYFAQAQTKINATAVCEVVGGPSYDVELTADAAGIRYSLDTTVVNFGAVAFDKTVEKEVILANPGKVAFPYRVNTQSLTRHSVLEVSPTKGTLQAGERVTLKMQITAGIPDRIDEFITLEVAHFEPIRVAIVGEGIYQCVALSLPRNVDDEFAPFLEEARELLREHGPRASLPAALREGVQPPPKTAGATTIRGGGSRPTTAATVAAAGRQSTVTIAGRQSTMSRASNVLPNVTAPTPTFSDHLHGHGGHGHGGSFSPVGGASPPPYTPSSAEVEHEADRLCMKAELLRREKEKADKAAARKGGGAKGAGVEPAPPVGGAPSATARRPSATMKRGGGKAAAEPPVVVSRYVYDFGHVTKGTTRHKRFRVQNVGASQAMFSWDKNILASHGFYVTPDNMPKLPGAPEYETTDVTVTLNTSLDTVVNGYIDVTVPLIVKGGPRSLVTLKAHITTPEIQVSSETLDFESVQVGHMKVMHVQLHNDQDVPAEWSVKKPPKKKERGVVDNSPDPFTFIPSHGSLQPGERKNVKVQFTPSGSPPRGFVQKVSIKVNHNKQLTVLTCKGHGHTLGLRCDPPVLDLGAVLPEPVGEDGEKIETEEERSAPSVQERVMWLVNDSAVDVEVYCADFDKQFMVDEDVLRNAEGLSTNVDGARLLLPPRAPGGGMWPHLVEADERRREAEEAAAAAVAAAAAKEAAAAEGGEEGAEGKDGEDGAAADADAADVKDGEDANGEVGELEAPEESAPAEPDDTHNILVTGTPFSHAEQTAAALAKRYQIPVLSVNECVDAAAAAFSDVGDAVRKDLNLSPLPGQLEHAAAIAEEKSAEMREAAEDGSDAAADGEEKSEGSADESADADAEAAPAGDGKLTVETLTGVLAAEIAGRYAGGFLIDGLACDCAAPAVVARALAAALGFAKADPAPAVPPEDAGDDWTAPEEEEGAFVLRGGKRLMVVSLDVEDDVAGKREKAEAAAVTAAAEAAAAALEAEALAAADPDAAAAAAAASEEAEAAATAAPAEDEAAAAAAPAAESSEEPSSEDASSESEASAAKDGSEAEEGSEPESEAYTYLCAEEAEAHRAMIAEVLPLFGKVGAPDNHAGVYSVDTNALGDADAVVDAGRAGGMPKPPNLPEWVPPPETLEIVTRPKQRLPRKPVTHFEILTPSKQPEWPGAKQPTPEPRDGEGGGEVDGEGGSDDDEAAAAREKEADAANDNADEDDSPGEMLTQTRWTIPANGAVQVVVRFKSQDVGVFHEELAFEIVGGQRGVEIGARGTCDYPKISDNYRNVYYRKTKVRPASAHVYHQYVISRTPSVPGKFEFGPLLCGKKMPGAPPPWTEGDVDPDTGEPVPEPTPGSHHPKENVEKLRITNSGLFDCTVAFSVKPRVDEEGNAIGDSGIFTLDPTEMKLGVDETRELLVMGYPTGVGPQEASIVAAVVDNPVDVEFPLSCVGVTPAVVLDIDDETGIAFERLLCGSKESKTFTVKNTCLLPVKWTLELPADLPEEFTVSQTEGELPANGEELVTVSFTAVEKNEFNTSLKLKVFDVEELLGVHQEKDIKVSAEAYKIEVVLKYPGEEEDASGVDFGLVKAIEDNLKQFSFTNTGKYQVGYKFGIRTAATRELFTVTPSEGEVEPGESVTIDLHFNKNKNLTNEVTLKANTDITLSISEPTTGVKHEKFPIRVSLRAAFTKYQILPARGMNFGPLIYNTTSNPRTFEISNVGEFPFDFNLFNYGGKGTEEMDEEGNPVAAVPPPKNAGDTLELGNFKVTPAAGTIEPGESATVDVTFLAENSRNYVELAGIDITDRDPSDQPLGIPYEIAGESCIPGINCEDFPNIFEEHKIVTALDPFSYESNVFAKRDKVFSFGPVTAQTSSDEEAEKEASTEKDGGDGGSPGGVGGKNGAEKRPGVFANFKISNPNKVSCSVDFAVNPRADENNAGGATTPEGGFPMDVHPAQLDIPPHEHRYVTVYFAPRAIATYQAVFEATVQGGGDPKTKQFTCELRGDGTLPHVTVEEPSAFSEEGAPLVKFPRLLLGKRLTRPITLRNNGIIPAVCRVDMPHSDVFTLMGGGQTTTLEPGRTQTLQLTYMPDAVGTHEHSVRLAVKQNAFEAQTIAVAGEAYMEDVMFTNLPHDMDDELRFDDGPVGGKPREVAFTVKNQSKRHWRFEWPENKEGEEGGDFTFAPRVGHLHAGASKTVVITFAPNAPAAHSPAELAMSLVPMTYQAPPPAEGEEPPAEGAPAVVVEPTDWDDTMKIAKEVEEEVAVAAAAEGEGDGAAADDKETGETETVIKTVMIGVEEPHHAAADDEARQLPLRVFAVADNARYECDVKPVTFRPTMMFQTRTHSFPLKNTSTARLEYNFTVEDPAAHGDSNPGPFEIKPTSGSIEAGETAMVTVRFSPEEVVNCARVLKCDFPGTSLDDGYAPLAVPLNGKVLRPWCHFELPESDYLSAGRRNPELPGPAGRVGSLDPATKTVEFESLGTKVRNTKRFFVLNPTSVAYEFVWEPVSSVNPAEEHSSAAPPSAFRCLNHRGVIAAGKKYEMVFEYTPDSEEIAESFFTFRIVEQSIAVPFLLVGHVVEPSVAFDVASINFGKVLVGSRSRETVTLSNNEHIPFGFNFDKSTFETPGGFKPVLAFEPSSGTVPPNSSIPVVVTFVPDLEKSLNYNVVATVRKKPSRLTLNVKGEGYAIHETLEVESSVPGEVRPMQLVAAPSKNAVDLGQVLINERCVRQVSFVNSGEINFDFAWDCGVNPRVSVKPETATVGKGERLVCELAYAPSAAETLDNYKVTCGIINGRKYNLHLNAVGHRPALRFSFHSFDFGPAFIHQAGMPPRTQTLTISNEDEKPFAIDCLFDSAAMPFLQLGDSPTMLAPGHSADMTVSFLPREAKDYRAVIPFQINGLYTVNVTVTGEGVPLRLDLANPAQTSVNFGSLRGGQSSTREVKLVNRSRLPVSVSLEPSVDQLASHDVVSANGAAPLVIPARQTGSLSLTYRPTKRARPFSEELGVTLAGGVSRVLAQLSGACLGTEVKLANDNLSFGTVTQGSRTMKRLQLQNTGDVGTKFAFDATAFAPHFSVFPSEGFVAPNQDVKLEITFHPTALDPDIRVERVKCQVEGASELALTLTGSCAAQEAQEGKLVFNTNVRQTATQEVTIKNPGIKPWTLKPTIQNDFWSGAEFLEVPAGKEAAYVLTYGPLAMSTEEAPHAGSVFFPLPDGTAILHSLEGVANEPTPSGAVETSAPCKAAHSVPLKVANWLGRRQRFKASVTIEGEEDPSVTLKGPDYIDLPGHAEREYKLGFYAYREGETKARVTFTNEETSEYLFYDVTVTATAAGLMGELELRAPVRQRAASAVTVANPLDTAVSLTCECPHAQVTCPPTLEIPAKGSASAEIFFRPVVVESDVDVPLTLTCPELGSFAYTLKLSSTPAGPERGLVFNVPLGSKEVHVFKFIHYLNDKADYACEFSSKSEEFAVQATVAGHPAGPEGMEQEVEVTFEPTRIGESFRDTLVVKSDTGGEYICPVMGRCIAPKPQGPFTLKGGAGGVSFKNVFGSETEFTVTVDNPAFTVNRTEKIPAKQAKQIAVSFKPESPDAPTTAKLLVTCAESPTPWVFYLRAG